MLKKVWIVSKSNIPESTEAAQFLTEYFKKSGVSVVSECVEALDLVICLTGDGTLLATIRRLEAQRYRVPVLGVHSSRGMGFIHPLVLPSEIIERQSWLKILADDLLGANYDLEERFGVEGVLMAVDAKPRLEFWAFNEAVISKGTLSRMVSFRIKVNNIELIKKARGDGLIVSSATGSTAYSLSAGGPIVHPKNKGLVVTPVCMHELRLRPLVLERGAKVHCEVLEGATDSYLTIDGQIGYDVKTGESVTMTGSRDSVKFLMPRNPHLVRRDFYEILTSKLKYGD